MKVVDSRHLKRERLRSGLRYAPEQKLDLSAEPGRSELGRFFVREHHLGRILALRYADCVQTALGGFPEGDIPEDVLESHVDALAFHDEAYSKKLFTSDDQVVSVLRGSATTARRFFQWLDEGDLFHLGGRTFRVTSVSRERVSEVTDETARLEGVTTLEQWKRRWLDNLPRTATTLEWDPQQLCVRHDFVATDLPEKTPDKTPPGRS